MKPAPQVVLCLDIDGVLHSSSREIDGPPIEAAQKRVDIVRGRLDPASLGLLDQGRQILLAQVLARHPHAKVVITSAWRSWNGYNLLADEKKDPVFEAQVKTLAWLKAWLLPEIALRIIGATPLGTSRLEEIREAMQEINPGGHWVALDDQGRHFPANVIPPFYQEERGKEYDYGVPGERVVVLIDGERGLSWESAAALDAALTHASNAMVGSDVPQVA